MDKRQQIKTIVQQAQDDKIAIDDISKKSVLCKIKNVEFIALQGNGCLRVVPVLFSEDREQIQDLYTKQIYHTQREFFSSMLACERISFEYGYRYPDLKDAKFRTLGNFIGVQRALASFYQKYNIGYALDRDYADLSRQLGSYDYHSKEVKDSVVSLSRRLERFFGGAAMVKEKIKTRDDDKKEVVEMGM